VNVRKVSIYVKLTNICKKISKIQGVTYENSADRCPSSVKASQPLVRATQKVILTNHEGLAGQNGARSDIREGKLVGLN